MSDTGGNINGTAGSEDVKLIRSVRQRHAEKVDIDEISGAQMMHAQSKKKVGGRMSLPLIARRGAYLLTRGTR